MVGIIDFDKKMREMYLIVDFENQFGFDPQRTNLVETPWEIRRDEISRLVEMVNDNYMPYEISTSEAEAMVNKALSKQKRKKAKLDKLGLRKEVKKQLETRQASGLVLLPMLMTYPITRLVALKMQGKERSDYDQGFTNFLYTAGIDID